MYTVDIKSILMNRTYPEAGDALYQQLVGKIENEDKIVLNLDGVDMLPSMFFNMSIGKIIDNFGVETLKKIMFTKITQMQVERIKNYISRISPNQPQLAN